MPKPKRSISDLLKSERAKKFITYDLLEEGQSLSNSQKKVIPENEAEGRMGASRAGSDDSGAHSSFFEATSFLKKPHGASWLDDSNSNQILEDPLAADPATNEKIEENVSPIIPKSDGLKSTFETKIKKPSKSRHLPEQVSNETVHVKSNLGARSDIQGEQSTKITSAEDIVERDLSSISPSSVVPQSFEEIAERKPLECLQKSTGKINSPSEGNSELEKYPNLTSSNPLDGEAEGTSVAQDNVKNQELYEEELGIRGAEHLLSSEESLPSVEKEISSDLNDMGHLEKCSRDETDAFLISSIKRNPKLVTNEETRISEDFKQNTVFPESIVQAQIQVDSKSTEEKTAARGPLGRRSKRSPPVTVGRPSSLPPPPNDFDFLKDERFLAKYWMSPGPGGVPRSQERFFNFYRYLYSEACRTRCARVYCTETMAIEVLGPKARGTFSNYRKLGVQFGLFSIHVVSNLGNSGQLPGTYFYLLDAWKNQ
jgi:hypothetical protein